MVLALPSLIQRVYNPLRDSSPWAYEELVGTHPRQFYDFGRSALWAALSDLKRGDRVLIPELICTEALDLLRELGLKFTFYSLTEELTPAHEYVSEVPSKAVVMVNFFGFPSPVAPFRRYQEKYSAKLIEDNAHGLLSRDEEGRLLGTRADYGVFSFRKTLPVSSGAALVLTSMNSFVFNSQPPAQDFIFPLSQRVKDFLRPFVAIGAWRLLPLAKRLLSLFRGCGKERNETSHVPVARSFLKPDFLDSVRNINLTAEIKRRRELYLWIASRWVGRIRPIFSELRDGTVPFSFPFYAEKDEAAGFAQEFERYGLEVNFWPTLPVEVLEQINPRFRKIYMVRFLW